MAEFFKLSSSSFARLESTSSKRLAISVWTIKFESAWAGNENTAVAYFSPASLLSAYLVPETELSLYRGESFTVQGRLGVGLGRQWQEGFTPRNVWFVRYEQDHRFPGGFTLGAGINYALQNYDGKDTGVWRLYFTAGI
jgi:hypothetical protein